MLIKLKQSQNTMYQNKFTEANKERIVTEKYWRTGE